MKITNVEISNFRILRNISTSMTEIMLLVGKNNSGKTSYFEIFDVFYGNKKFVLADFSKGLISKVAINSIYEEFKNLKEISEESINLLVQRFPMIELKLTLDLSSVNDYSSIKPLLYELENNDCLILISRFKFYNIMSLFNNYENYNNKVTAKIKEKIDFFDYFLEEYDKYYRIEHYTTKPDKKEKSPIIDNSAIKDIFRINIIKARRDVDDATDQNKQAISSSLWKYFQLTGKTDIKYKHLFSDQTDQIKKTLETKYEEIFDDIIKTIQSDLLLNDPSMTIKILSNIDIETMLKSNAKLRYIMGDIELSEAYNGLGFSNLIYIFIEIYHFNSLVLKDDRPLNILFIEEPESHLHPQMQLTFYKKLQKVLNESKNTYIVFSTHSSHLLSISEFKNINYFFREKENVSIKSLETFITENKEFETFLRKYFKLNTADLFFAEKAILYEGSAERILFPAFLEKYDAKSKSSLSNQHISLFEVGGRYAHVFFKLLEYLNLKSLIIADIDSVKDKTRVSCDINEDIRTKINTLKTSNGVIKKWFNFIGSDLFIKELIDKPKELFVKTDCEINMCLTTQLPHGPSYHCGRTLEEDIIIKNALKISTDINNRIVDKEYVSKFKIISRILNVSEKIDSTYVVNNAFNIVEEIDKTGFALELIENLDHWDLPDYIEEGLKWLDK